VLQRGATNGAPNDLCAETREDGWLQMIGSDVVEAVIAGWRDVDKRQCVDDYPCGVPSAEDISLLLNTAFFASLQKEEDVFVTFTLVFLATYKDFKPRHNFSQFTIFLPLDRKEELTVEAVKKLSGAIDNGVSAIIVERHDNSYFITGISTFGGRSSLLTGDSCGYPRTESLSITVRAPGVLIVCRGGTVIGRLSEGELQLAEPTPFHSRSLGGDIIARIKTHPNWQRFDNSYWHWYHACLDHLLRSARSNGHGGTFIWVPEYSIDDALGKVRLGHSVGKFPVAHELLCQSLEADQKNGESQKTVLDVHRSGARDVNVADAASCVAFGSYIPNLKAKLCIIIEMIAKLSSVDGAVIVDEFFVPRIFGARLSAEIWRGEIIKNSFGTVSDARVNRERFGTRHNSAIDFAADVDGAIAFVLSQDGPVRAFTRRGDAMHMWPDCMSSVFFE
jgi:hypothetical protein